MPVEDAVGTELCGALSCVSGQVYGQHRGTGKLPLDDLSEFHTARGGAAYEVLSRGEAPEGAGPQMRVLAGARGGQGGAARGARAARPAQHRNPRRFESIEVWRIGIMSELTKKICKLFGATYASSQGQSVNKVSKPVSPQSWRLASPA